MDQHSSALARRYGLTGPQLAVLQTLATSGDTTTSELARRLSLSQPTVTGIVQRMLAKELVSRRPSEWDRRALLLSLTARGQRVLAEAPPLLRQPFMDRLSQLERGRQAQLVQCLRQLVAMIELPPFPSSPSPSSSPRRKARETS